MAHAGKLIGSRQSAGPRADNEDALAAWLQAARQWPALRGCLVAEKPFNRMDADAAVQLPAIAGTLARVIANPAMHCGQRVVPDQALPRITEFSGLRQIEPALNILASRAGMIAGWQKIDIKGMSIARWPRHLAAGHIHQRAHVMVRTTHRRTLAPLLHGTVTPTARLKRLMLRRSSSISLKICGSHKTAWSLKALFQLMP